MKKLLLSLLLLPLIGMGQDSIKFHITKVSQGGGWQGSKVLHYYGESQHDTAYTDIGKWGIVSARDSAGVLQVYDSAKAIVDLYESYKALDKIIKGRDKLLSLMWPILEAETIPKRNAAVKKLNSYLKRKPE